MAIRQERGPSTEVAAMSLPSRSSTRRLCVGMGRVSGKWGEEDRVRVRAGGDERGRGKEQSEPALRQP